MKSRRAFLGEVSLASVGAALSQAATRAPAPTPGARVETLLPKAIRAGAKIALVAPASPPSDPEGNVQAQELVRSFGFTPMMMPNAARATMYLAGTDQERAADLNAAFAHPNIDAVWCLRGGYGSPRILPYLDYDLIRKHPKPLIGYSDITAPLLAIHARTGLVTFHGPLAGENQTDYTLLHFKKVLYEPSAAGQIGAPPPFPAREGQVERQNRLKKITGGRTRGPLVGGNLSVLTALFGTPYEPDLKGRILFLEEVGEEPYRIDRWMTQLLLTGKLQECAGIALGKFTDCGPREFRPSFNGTFTWQEVAADRLGALGIPVLAGLMFGHVNDKATLPLGVVAELDADAGTLTLLQPAVR
ncbi:MAG TPA: LD-carboxypeptidase [Thermoanaerobaculia bacterium]|nr:LD-carboxypeptidase [Thermoanaerobaculia bacterium]